MNKRACGIAIAWLGGMMLAIGVAFWWWLSPQLQAPAPLPAGWQPGGEELTASWTILGEATPPLIYESYDESRHFSFRGGEFWVGIGAGVPLAMTREPLESENIFWVDRLMRTQSTPPTTSSYALPVQMLMGTFEIGDQLVVGGVNRSDEAAFTTVVILDPITLTERGRYDSDPSEVESLLSPEANYGSSWFLQVDGQRMGFLFDYKTELVFLPFDAATGTYGPASTIVREPDALEITIEGSQIGSNPEKRWRLDRRFPRFWRNVKTAQRPPAPAWQRVSPLPIGWDAGFLPLGSAPDAELRLRIEFASPDLQDELRLRIEGLIFAAKFKITGRLPRIDFVPKPMVYRSDEIVLWDERTSQQSVVRGDLALVAHRTLAQLQPTLPGLAIFGTWMMNFDGDRALISQVVYSPPESLTDQSALLRLGILRRGEETVGWLGWIPIEDLPATHRLSKPRVWMEEGAWIVGLHASPRDQKLTDENTHDWLAWCRIPNPLEQGAVQ